MKKSGLLERHVVWVPKRFQPPLFIFEDGGVDAVAAGNGLSHWCAESQKGHTGHWGKLALPPLKLEIWVLTPELAAEIKRLLE